MRVNSDLLKHLEFLTIMFDGTRNFLYSPVLLYLYIRGSSISERGGIFVVGSNWKILCSKCLLWYNISIINNDYAKNHNKISIYLYKNDMFINNVIVHYLFNNDKSFRYIPLDFH